MSRAIIIFVRSPERGKVKTRLAATLGDDRALEIYLGLLAHTHAITKALEGVSKYVFYAGAVSENDLWSEGSYHKLLQPEGDLGTKMYTAFEHVFSAGHTQVLIIGSDCPGLTSDGLEAAFKGLAACDAVIGPANDGGYYLLGLKELRQEFFLQKHWSTEGVYEATVADFRALGLSFYTLPELVDIDTEEDWNLAQGEAAK